MDKEFQNLNLSGDNIQTSVLNSVTKKTGPLVPPKPLRKEAVPEVPKSRNVKQAYPLYSQRLQLGSDIHNSNVDDSNEKADFSSVRPPLLQRKKQLYPNQNYDCSLSKVTLDNPAVLDQQLEVLTHHKKQLEKKGLLPSSSAACVPKFSTTSLARSSGDTENCYANVLPTTSKSQEDGLSYSNVKAQRHFFENMTVPNNASDIVYTNLNNLDSNSFLTTHEEDIPAPPSPVSSSYSELRRATDVFAINKDDSQVVKNPKTAIPKSYMNIKYSANGSGFESFSCYSPTLQGSSTYESIYEPINPRPPSQMSSASNYLSYSPYTNTTMHSQLPDRSVLSNSSSLNLSSIDASNDDLLFYNGGRGDDGIGTLKPETEIEALTGYLVHSMENESDNDSFGICFKCNERVLGESSGCTAMNQIYHVHCFTCSQCQINLQGKPFYALEGKPFCEYDYLQTLEKCSVCMKPILERILRATGKPYHPQCFTCVVCNKSLDSIPFTVDATNQNYCIEDFHKKFAPRCCVCKEPIMPEPGEEETVRVVALDRSFHFECYKCEDCGLLLSSEAEGRGCYPLDDHVLCKSCNAQRVQLLTNRITTEL